MGFTGCLVPSCPETLPSASDRLEYALLECLVPSCAEASPCIPTVTFDRHLTIASFRLFREQLMHRGPLPTCDGILPQSSGHARMPRPLRGILCALRRR